jgi:hypothetical protein
MGGGGGSYGRRAHRHRGHDAVSAGPHCRESARTEQQLAGLDSAKPEERARLIETIIAQNRIYALAAERAGEPQLARVLRAFAPVLEGLEHGDSSGSIAQLTFELRVMQGRLGAGTASTNTESTTL